MTDPCILTAIRYSFRLKQGGRMARYCIWTSDPKYKLRDLPGRVSEGRRSSWQVAATFTRQQLRSLMAQAYRLQCAKASARVLTRILAQNCRNRTADLAKPDTAIGCPRLTDTPSLHRRGRRYPAPQRCHTIRTGSCPTCGHVSLSLLHYILTATTSSAWQTSGLRQPSSELPNASSGPDHQQPDVQLAGQEQRLCRRCCQPTRS